MFVFYCNFSQLDFLSPHSIYTYAALRGIWNIEFKILHKHYFYRTDYQINIAHQYLFSSDGLIMLDPWMHSYWRCMVVLQVGYFAQCCCVKASKVTLLRVLRRHNISYARPSVQLQYFAINFLFNSHYVCFIFSQGNSNMAAVISMAICFLHKIVSSRMQLMNLLPWMSSGITTLPFACISDPIRKPIPLKLDVTFPPLPDVRWSISRLYYLFNSQLERNIVL